MSSNLKENLNKHTFADRKVLETSISFIICMIFYAKFMVKNHFYAKSIGFSVVYHHYKLLRIVKETILKKIILVKYICLG